MFVYKINILEQLKIKGYSTAKLRNEKLLGENAIQSIRNGEVVGINSLDKICSLLCMQPGELIEHIKD